MTKLKFEKSLESRTNRVEDKSSFQEDVKEREPIKIYLLLSMHKGGFNESQITPED
jgi:hypothetical protein